MAFGLSKLNSGSGSPITADVSLLTEGARWETGNAEAPVTVVAFTDIQCPACKAAEPVAEELRRTSGVRFIHRHFPLLTIHKNAWKGAKALEAARIMGKGWEMMALMFEKQSAWEDLDNPDSTFIEYAKELGLDETTFKERYTSSETDDLVGVDYALGNRLKLSGTPTFFVNGEQVSAQFVLSKVKELLK